MIGSKPQIKYSIRTRHVKCLILIPMLIISSLCNAKRITREGINYVITSDSTVGVLSYRQKDDSRKTIIEIPDFIKYHGKKYSVTSLEPFAFYNCPYMETLILPESLNTIKKQSVMMCNSLGSVSIPCNVRQIDVGAIGRNHSLSNITVHEHNPYYDSRDNCNAIIRKSDNTLMVGCVNTVIPEDISYIADQSFLECEGISSVTIPVGIKRIGDYAFYGCVDLETVILQDGIKEIGQASFGECHNLYSINIPESTVYIHDRAFYNCNSLKQITIPGSVNEIGTEVFSGDTSLQSITVSPANRFYDSYGNSNVIVDCKNKSLIAGCNTSVIPEDVISIRTGVFRSCHGIKTVNIPDCVEFISGSAFMDCTGIEQIHLPQNMYAIADLAFHGCSQLQSICLPDSLQIIWNESFSGCESLKEIDIPSKVWCIDASAFMNCKNLERVSLPEGVSEINNYSFWGCDNLESVNIFCLVPPRIHDRTFSRYGILHVKKGYAKVYKKSKYWKRFTIIDDL